MAQSIYEQFELVAARKEDWQQFSEFHYRRDRLYFFDRLFAMRHCGTGQLAAMVVYSFATANNSTRNKVLAGLQPKTITKKQSLRLINHDIRTISRLVVLPTFRGIGLGSELLRRSMPLLDVRFVEAIAVMAKFSSVFINAGLKQYAVEPNRHIKTAQRLLLKYNLDQTSSVDHMFLVIAQQPPRIQEQIITTIYNFACHYHRTLRNHKPDAGRIEEYLSIMKLQLNTSPAYFVRSCMNGCIYEKE